jgi:hypothetical protein
MAEFKLGRIKFVWKNAWNGGTTYYVDDVVRFGGKTFICVEGHTAASDFYTDLNNVPTKWNRFADGQSWLGDWNPTTSYKINDIVRYGGYTYICNLAHTSGTLLEDDQSKWDIFAEGFSWQGDWDIDFVYKVNDIVKYGGNVYICNEAHTSDSDINLGLEEDQSKWDLFTEGFDWKSSWVTSTRYKVNDVVKYGGQVYVCNQHHISSNSTSQGLELDQSKWDYFHKGTEFLGNWTQPTRYKVNDLVRYGSAIWRCITEHTSSTNFSTVNFEIFVPGIRFQETWNPAVIYTPGDIVRYGGYSYVSKSVHSNENPASTAEWELIVTNFKLVGDWDTLTSYKVGEVVRHGGYTYSAIQDNSSQSPPNASFWSRLNSGLRWRDQWDNSVNYILGDIVRFKSFSYICVQPHLSDDDDSTFTTGSEPNSPEKDTAGNFWNLLTAGLEESVLSNVGDLVYFSPQGISALGIGEEGQVLTVENGVPAWKFWGASDKVYYVGLHGEDSPAPVYGITLDKPFRTVRYATEQIEKGAEFPNAGYLLRQNRTFVQKEIVEWVDYQITNNIAPFTTGFSYNKDLCQRDMGLLLDAVTYDLTHGGNVESIKVAQSYFTPLGQSYIVGEETQTVAAINYGIELIDKILKNEAPSQNYQALNLISEGNRIKQIINFDYSSENKSFDIVSSLAEITTDAITAGDLDGLPKESVPGYTINVKTGLFEEVLPIIVPANTAVVGDELRSTKVSPAGKLIADNDKAKSLATLNYIKTIFEDIITNTAIVKTTGNTLTQITSAQRAGNVGSSTAVTRVIADSAIIKNILSNNVIPATVLTNPTGWGSTLDDVAYATTGNVTGDTTGYNNARAQLQVNKNFIVAEITAWIEDQIAGPIAPFTSDFTYNAVACARDVGLILDAVIYDITYGGNTQTRIAADAYYSFGQATFGQGEKLQTLAAYVHLQSIVSDVITETIITPSTGNLLTQDTSGTAGSADSAEFAEDRIQEIIDTITADGTLPTLIEPATSWVSAELVEARTRLISQKTVVQSDSVQYIKREYPQLLFNETTCSRDVGYIVDALGYDLMFNSNFASITAGRSYRRGTESAQLVVAEQLEATEDIIEFIGKKSSYIVASGAAVTADLLWDDIIDYVDTGTAPIIVGTNRPTEDLDLINGAKILQLNKEFLAEEAVAWVADNFSTTVTASSAVTNEFTCGDTSWMVEGDAVRFSGTTFGGVNSITTYYIDSIVDGTTFTISSDLNGSTLGLLTASGTMVVSFFYKQDRCRNDVYSYIESIAYDLVYTGNYKSTYAARYYRNALTGSKLEDMYYVRNGCGLRNQTTLGLDGSSDGNTSGIQDPVVSRNEFGVGRPRAGAYASLDPGWGPNDQRVWVVNKSTYVQNITTFGIGATGQKIDGALHAGGNDSIVSNDFTQVISDGIGAWVTNLGRAELVSVFTYYAHVGYLAENGGKIRATNGNNSYGEFGSVAEGIDLTEVPITATVNNRSQQASVANILTNNSNLLMLEYLNAGSEYNSANYTVSGAGGNASLLGNETRDGGVFQVRLTDPGDSSGTGGEGYITASNVAQGGTTTQITLAATDIALSGAYNGMAIYIVAGTGVGQYGYINSFNAGNKVATVRKDSTDEAGWDHIVPGTPIAGALDLTTVYEIVPRLRFTDPPYNKSLRTGLASYDWKDLIFGDGFARYTSIFGFGGSGSNANFNVTRRFGNYSVVLNNGGFGYQTGDVLTIQGTALGGTSPDNTLTITVGVVDSDTGEVLSVESSGNAIQEQWVAVAHNTNEAYTSVDGVNWTARTLPATAKWNAIAYGAVADVSYYVAIAYESQDVAYSIDGINWTASSLGETWQWTDIAYGNGTFVVVAESDSSLTRRAVSANGGQSWTLGDLSTGAKAITFGQGRFVVVEGFFSNVSAYSENGFVWVTRTLPANLDSTESNWQDVAYGNNRFVAIADNDAQVAVSVDRGVTWVAAQLPVNAPWKKVAYGNGVFLAFAEGDIAASSTDGFVWQTRDMQATDIDILLTSKDDIVGWTAGTNVSANNWEAVAFGNGRYVAVSSDVTAAYSTNNGVSWTASTIPGGVTDQPNTIAFGNGIFTAPLRGSNDVITSSNGGESFVFQSNVLSVTRDWSAIAFGNNTFVMVAEGSNTTAVSANGSTWTVFNTNLPSSSEWTSITFGDGRFVAVSGVTADSNAVAYSTNNGTTWAAGTMPSSTRWSSVTYGNGRFVAVAGNSGTTTTAAAYSTNGGQTWTGVTLPGAAARWTNVTFNGSVFVATAFNSNRSVISEDGITWIERTLSTTANWKASASDTDNYRTVVVSRGTTAVNNLFYEANTNLLTVFDTSILAVGDYIIIVDDSAGRSSEAFGGLELEKRYYIKSIVDGTRFTVSENPGGPEVVLTTGSGSMFATVNKIWSALAYGKGSTKGFLLLGQNNPAALKVEVGTRTRARPAILDNKIFQIWINEPGSNYDSLNPPTMIIEDPNNIGPDATFEVRVSNGVLAQPTFNNRGINYTTASATVTGDGFADNYQASAFVNFKDISDIPKAGSNLRIEGIDDIYYKIVNIRGLRGVGPYTAEIQVSPTIGPAEAPEHDTDANIRSRFSQVRLTGHDFLDIGTGNQIDTNYPGLPLNDPNPANETVLIDGGRVFWTSTDQDGNFRVGGLFNVEQATGTATLNAEAFNLAGLNELSLGTVALGGGGATISEFSTDPFFTADSDSVIPTQRAIKAYINSQIGGGSGSLNVNTITAGIIFIAGQSITTTTLQQININTKVNFTGGVDGYGIATSLFLQS